MHLIMKILQVKQEKPKKIPAFTQENGLGRLQTALKLTNAHCNNWMKAFYKKTCIFIVSDILFNKKETIVLKPK